MKESQGLLSSLDLSWKNFSGAWKKARTKASEKSIHDLRVNTRRLIAILELAKALSGKNEVVKVQRRFKKVLKRMGPLRDTQVLLVNVSQVRQTGLIKDFKKTLIRREKRKIDNVRGDLKNSQKKKLSKSVAAVRSEFRGLTAPGSEQKIRRSLDRVLTLRQSELLKAQHTFHRSQPMNEDLLHEMRIALKKFRYVVEAAQTMLGDSAKERARELHAFQQLIGESRDLELLRDDLEKWANKKGKKLAVVPAL